MQISVLSLRRNIFFALGEIFSRACAQDAAEGERLLSLLNGA
jgi:hypothetical protein